MRTPIALFSVPSGHDGALLDAWDAAPPAGAVLHRALRGEVAFRFVAIGGAPPGAMPAHAARYAPVAEHGTPDVPGGTLLIEAWDAGATALAAGWKRRTAAIAPHRGHLGGRLLEAPGTAFPFVAVTRWSSPLMWFRAANDAALQGALAQSAAAQAALYQPVRGEDPPSG